MSVGVLWAVPLIAESCALLPQVQGQTATNPLRYQVNYRASATDPWQLYASTRNLNNANSIAAEVKSTGYQTQVVTN